MPNLVDEYKTIFLGKRQNSWNSSKTLSLYCRFLYICFEFCQKPKWNLPSASILVHGFIMPSMVEKYKTIFSGKLWQTLKLSQNFLPISRVSYKFVLKSIKTLNWIFWAMEYWFKSLEYQIWLKNTKLFFWERQANLGTLRKLSSYIGVSHKFIFKSFKSLTRVFWVMEYWLKNLEWQIWSTNTKPFFWESKKNLVSLQNLIPSIGVFLKFVLNSVKNLNRIFWVIEYWFKALKC